MSGFDLETTYLSLDGAGAVAEHPGGAAFWASVETNATLKGTLVIVVAGDSDWPHWEMHPAGQEILVMLEGEQTLLLDGGAGETRHLMTAGTTLVVPAGVWHRALIDQPTRMLAITYGAGTQHRAL